MSFEDYGPSWDYLDGRATTTPARVFLDLLKLPKASDQYAEWVRIVEYAVLHCIDNLVRAKNIHKGSGEDKLTNNIVDSLTSMGLDARFEQNVGGNCDISIYNLGGMIWLGECKIYRSSGNLFGGFRQLIDRYSSGMPKQDQGALIVYIFVDDALRRMSEWRSRLLVKAKGIRASLPAKGELEFETWIEHTSGRTVRTRHLPVVLHHEPTDPLPLSMKGNAPARIGKVR